MMHPGSASELTAAIRTCVDGMIADLCGQAGADATDVLELTIVGNPIMHHLFLGLDPTELGGAPFALATDEAVHRGALELDLTTTNAGARVYVLPCIAGHVGADTAGVILSGAARPGRGDLVIGVARTRRSCSATATSCSPRRARPVRRSRARRSPAGSARRRGRSSASASIARP